MDIQIKEKKYIGKEYEMNKNHSKNMNALIYNHRKEIYKEFRIKI